MKFFCGNLFGAKIRSEILLGLITLCEWMGNISLILSNNGMSLRRINSNSFAFPLLNRTAISLNNEKATFILCQSISLRGACQKYFWIVSSSMEKYLEFYCTSYNPNLLSILLTSSHILFSVPTQCRKKHSSLFRHSSYQVDSINKEIEKI